MCVVFFRYDVAAEKYRHLLGQLKSEGTKVMDLSWWVGASTHSDIPLFGRAYRLLVSICGPSARYCSTYHT